MYQLNNTVFFACFRPYVRQPDDHIGWVTLMPFKSIYPTDPRTNPAQFDGKILRIDGFEKVVFLSRPFWICFFQKKIFFCLIPWKAVKGSWVARMGRNFDDYPGFQPMRSWANTYAQDCTKRPGFSGMSCVLPGCKMFSTKADRRIKGSPPLCLKPALNIINENRVWIFYD